MRTPDEERSFTFYYGVLANKAAQILTKIKNGRLLNEDDKHRLGLIVKFLGNTLSVYEYWGRIARNKAAVLQPSKEKQDDHEIFSAVVKQLPDLLPGQRHDPRNARELNFLYRITSSIAKGQESDTSAEVMEGLAQAISFFRKMRDEMNKRYGVADARCDKEEFDDAC